MNIKLLGLVAAFSSVALVACGDSGTTSGGGGGDTGGGGTGGSTNSTGGGSTGGGGTGGSGGGASCEDQFPAGYETASGLVIAACGCETDAPCETECTGSTECDPTNGTDMPACGTCIQGEADAKSACALGAATSQECSSDPDCADYVQCVITAG